MVGKVTLELEALRKAKEKAEKAEKATDVTESAKPVHLTDLDTLFEAALAPPATPVASAYRRVFPTHPHGNAHALGPRLHHHRDRTTNGRRIEQAGEKDGSKLWKVVHDEKPTGGNPPPDTPPSPPPVPSPKKAKAPLGEKSSPPARGSDGGSAGVDGG